MKEKKKLYYCTNEYTFVGSTKVIFFNAQAPRMVQVATNGARHIERWRLLKMPCSEEWIITKSKWRPNILENKTGCLGGSIGFCCRCYGVFLLFVFYFIIFFFSFFFFFFFHFRWIRNILFFQAYFFLEANVQFSYRFPSIKIDIQMQI